ncbi:MAG: pyrroloquinoline quinone biosynthesis protein PqqB, partial [Chloroflexi bacterium]|nr:pyrroloquinoline quinone biosynthesis protein PqqB [Chloroflexota bacterium]
DADIDHTLGLLVLREGSPLTIYATSPIHYALMEGLNVPSTLASYCPVEWRNPALELSTLRYADGTASGLRYAAFPVAGKPPRYLEHRVASQTGERVGYRFHDEKTGGRLLFLPGMAVLDEAVKEQMRDCDGLLLDGTFWSEQEMQERNVGTTRAGQMGHLPVGGPQGSLQYIAALPIRHKIYTHINNTNPMLREDSPEYATVKKAGVQIGWDGLEFVL